METWTRNKEGRWERWDHPGLALDALGGAAPPVTSLLVVGLGPEDDEQLVAAIRLTRRLATGPVVVVAGSVHPSEPWLESVRGAGADLALCVAQPKQRGWHDVPPLDDVIELDRGICPELHSKPGARGALSVCGRHRDLMVLARHHLRRWCLDDKQACPHWRGVDCRTAWPELERHAHG